MKYDTHVICCCKTACVGVVRQADNLFCMSKIDGDTWHGQHYRLHLNCPQWHSTTWFLLREHFNETIDVAQTIETLYLWQWDAWYQAFSLLPYQIYAWKRFRSIWRNINTNLKILHCVLNLCIEPTLVDWAWNVA